MKKGILFLVFCVLLSSQVFASELTDDYFDIATNYFNSNNIAKAVEYLDLILTIEPDNRSAKELKAKVEPVPFDAKKAEQEAIKMMSETADLEKLEIVAVPSEDISKNLYNAEYYNTKGQEFFQQGNFDEAIQYFYKSLSLNKNNPIAYNNLGMCYWRKGNLDVAIKNFKIANSKNKIYTQPLVNLANLYMQKGEMLLAYSAYKKAITLNPNDYLAYYYLGDYYRKVNKYPNAIKAYQEVIKIDKKFPQVYLKLAMSFFEIEEFEYCEFTLKQYLELCNDSDFAYYILAKCESALAKYEDAYNYINAALMLHNCDTYKNEQAKILYQQGEYELAQVAFEKLLQTNEDASLFNYLGLCLYKQKNVDAAILNFKKSLDIDGLRPIYYYNLAQCYKSIGDKKSYVKYINTATKIQPQNYQDFIDLSYIFFDNSNVTYAINTLNDGIKKYPNNKALYLSKLRIYDVTGDSADYKVMKEQIDRKFNNYEEKKQEK